MVKILDLSSTMKNFCMDPLEVRITHLNPLEARRSEANRNKVSIHEVLNYETDDYINARSHASTHVDAPWHFGPTSAGKPAKTIDQIPLEWCYGNGILLDFSLDKKPGKIISESDLKKKMESLNYCLKEMDIVLIRTGAEDHQDDPRFEQMAAGLDKASLMWLLDQGIKHIATDAYTLDIPIPNMVEELKKGNRQAFFPVHYAGREREYIHSEKLFNLKNLPNPFGFKVALFPIKIEGASGGWTRAVAIEEEGGLKKIPKLFDLSVPLMPQSMEGKEIIIDRFSHEEGARRLCKRFGINLKILPKPGLWATEEISCSSHAGTHVDAFWPHEAEEETTPKSKTIDQIPVERFYGDGILLDFSNKGKKEPISSLDILKALDKIGCDIKSTDIVLMRTGAEEKFLHDPGFKETKTFLSSDALGFLIEKGVTLIGTDSCSLYLSDSHLKQEKQRHSSIFPGISGGGICHAEKLFNLKALPVSFGFKVAMFPIKLENCLSSWTRAVAIC